MEIPKPVGQQLESKLVEIINQIQAGVVEAGKTAGNVLPKLTDIAVRMTYWEGLCMLGVGLALLLIAYGLFKLGRWSINQNREAWNIDGMEGGPQVAGIIMYIATVICFIVGAYNFLHPWNWIAVFDPEAALAHKILIMILNRGSSGG